MRRPVRGTAQRFATRLTFSAGCAVVVIERPNLDVAVSCAGDPDLWAPFEADEGTFVAVAGRPVFDDEEWSEVPPPDGRGGRAAGILLGRYRTGDVAELGRVNGSVVIVVYDAIKQLVHVVTDRCGVTPTFEAVSRDGYVFGSHPDVTADAAGVAGDLDETSLAEFVLSGTVTPPFSYYTRVRAADYGTLYTIDLAGDGARRPRQRRYFDFSFRGDASTSEDQLADDLAAALQRAVRRRTLARLGRCAVALSGGLDSRAILSCGLDTARAFAFTCFDRENRELRTARAIATELGVSFLPLQRGPDYYADHAEAGVRISGGMGSVANNHFLGVIPRLGAEGAKTLLTGCYCDYLFKGLPLNRRTAPFTRRERLAPYRHEFYFEHFDAATPLAALARDRIASRIPSEFRSQDSPATVFQVEARRTFPLCYEGDNQQRLVPMRLTGWCSPFVDRDVIDVYCRIPYQYKLNRSIFRKVVSRLAPALGAIEDTNTGARVDALPLVEWLSGVGMRAQRGWRRVISVAATDESWPDWRRYAPLSGKLNELWARPNPEAFDVFRRVLGESVALMDGRALARERTFLYTSMLTVKIWLGQRFGV